MHVPSALLNMWRRRYIIGSTLVPYKEDFRRPSRAFPVHYSTNEYVVEPGSDIRLQCSDDHTASGDRKGDEQCLASRFTSSSFMQEIRAPDHLKFLATDTAGMGDRLPRLVSRLRRT